MRRGIAALLALLPVLVPRPSCSGDDPVWYNPDPESRPGIKVLGRGAEPHSPLRWKHVKGKSERGNVSVHDVSDDTKLGRAEEKAVASVTVRVNDVNRAGETRCVCVFDRLEWTTTDPERSAPKEAWSTWAGSSRTLTLTPQGILKKEELAPAKSAQHVQVLFNPLIALGALRPPPFPTDLVGVGARWQVTGKPISNWAMHETTVCTLTARDGDRVTIELSLTRTAKPQKNVLVKGVTSKLLEYSGTGSGTFELDLTCVLPAKGTVTVSEEESTELHVPETETVIPSECKSTWKLDMTGCLPPATPR